MRKRTVELLSVDDILKRIRDQEWRFVVAQRSFEWDENRISNLIDSLLDGFPIGSLLVAEVDGPGYAAKAEKTGRIAKKGKPGATEQLLDGQQRCLSLQAAFEEGVGFLDRHGTKKHLWIRIDGPNSDRKAFHPKEGRRVRLHWTDRESLVGMSADDRKVERMTVAQTKPGWIRFARLAKYCKNKSAPFIANEAGLKDPSPEVLRYIRNLTKQMVATLTQPSIPVHRWSRVQGREDLEKLHHAFVRLNTGGKALRAEDQFFAGVKLYWVGAEEGIKPLVEKSHGLLDYREALALVARIARRTLPPEGKQDCYPLQLQHLSEKNDGTRRAWKNELVTKMEQLVKVKPATPVSDRLLAATDEVCGHLTEQFQGGAAHLGSPQLAACIAWAFLRKANGGTLRERDLNKLAKFAFWTTVFNCHSYGRGPFGRSVMARAWQSGQDKKPLPIKDDGFRRACYDHRFVADELWKPRATCFVAAGDSSEPGNATQLIRRNRSLFLKSFQRIEMDQHIEWDHILPFVHARRMFRHDEGQGTDPRYLNWISAPGNFAGIDMKANRRLGDTHLKDKFRKSSGVDDKTYLNPDFILTDPQVTEAERALLMQIYGCRGKKHEAGALFVQFVVDRTKRIWDDAVRRVGKPPGPLPAANKSAGRDA